MDKRFKDLTNKKFGKLLVLSFSHQDKYHKSYWLCQCDCGTKCIKRSDSLSSGTKSCGCLLRSKLFLGYSKAAFNSLYGSYKRNARNKNLSFDLKEDEFKQLTTNNCYYCKAKPSQVYKSRHATGDYIFNGIDRVDNLKGYTLDNCVTCCGICNKMKGSMPLNNFLKQCIQVADTWSK